jgi:hypothetical protein
MNPIFDTSAYPPNWASLMESISKLCSSAFFATVVMAIITIFARPKLASVLNNSAFSALFVDCRFKILSMKYSVFAIGQNHKIGNLIVQFILINMMDMFFGLKRTANMSFHYMSMLIDFLVIYVNNFITIYGNCARTSWRNFQKEWITMQSQPRVVSIAKTFSFKLPFASLDFAKPLMYLVRIHSKAMNRIAFALQNARVCPMFTYHIFQL